MLENKPVVIIGASGFVARNFRKFLYEKNLKVISISRKNFKSFPNETKIVSKNYLENELISKIKNCSTLFHLVGIGNQSSKTTFESVNYEFTKHILSLSKKANIKKIIYLSGLGVSQKSTSGYFISKFKAEQEIIKSNLDYVIFRPSYIVGKDDLLTKFLKKQISNGRIEMPGTGNFMMQPIYIKDVVEIFYQSLTRNNFKNVMIDLVGPELITFKKFITLFSKQNKTKIKHLDLELVYRRALNDPKSEFGLDDLNILMGDFKGDSAKLTRIFDLNFHSVSKLLNVGGLS